MLDKIKTRVKSASQTITSRTKRNKQGDGQYIVGLDIGTEFVKALIGKIVEGNKIEIIGTGRTHQELSDMQAGAISDISAVVNNCDQALNQAEQQAGVSARGAVIGIAGELVKGTTTHVRCRRKDPTKEMGIEEVERIIKLVQTRARERAKQQLVWELGGKDVEIRIVNSALVGIEIDGYPVTNPVGFKGKDVVVQLYTAFAPMIHIGALERTAHELDLDLVAVAAEPFAVARSVIGDDPNASMSAILMDVGGGTTDIAVINVRDPYQTRGIIERDLGVSFLQAEELKVGLSDNKVPQAKVSAIEAALKKTLDVWLSGVDLALGEFPQLDHLPHRLLLCGGGSSLDMLMDKLEQSNWYSQLPFTRKPVVQHIQPSQVIGIVDKTGSVTDHTYITAMGLLRVGIDTLGQHDSSFGTGSLRERIDKILRV